MRGAEDAGEGLRMNEGGQRMLGRVMRRNEIGGQRMLVRA